MINLLKKRGGPLFRESVFVPRIQGDGYEQAIVEGDLKEGYLVKEDGTRVKGSFKYMPTRGEHGTDTRTLVFSPHGGQEIIVNEEGLTSLSKERKG